MGCKMQIIEKLTAKQKMYHNKPVTIAFFGDSVTQGCFECYVSSANTVESVYDYKSAYSTRLREILTILYPNVQVNIINSGISGDNVKNARTRIERDVLPYSPDLVVVSFGLNDSSAQLEGLEDYAENLKYILNKVAENGAEVIFLTQNAMNTAVSCHLKEEKIANIAKETMVRQNNGVLKAYMDKAREIALECGATVCDTYPIWEKLIKSGVNTTELLSNKINHPIRDWHYYMAIKLLETMFEI